jgi:hypothetical protein
VKKALKERNRQVPERLPIMLVGALAVSCGYQAVYSGASPGRLHVKVVRNLAADAIASEEVASGMRELLARAGALAPGEGFPRAEIEVLRTDETSEAITAGSAGPVARATDVGILARAWVVREAGAPPESDTGDLRADDLIAVDRTDGVLDARAAAFHDADAIRAAARRLGMKLGAKLVGGIAASEEREEMGP